MWVITKLDWFQGSFLCILGSLLKVNVQNGDILGVAKISNKFWGMPDIPDIFLLTVDAASKPTYEEKNKSTPPPGIPPLPTLA